MELIFGIYILLFTGVDHLPSILNSAAEATSSNLRSLALHSREKVYKLTSAFEKLTYTEAGKDAATKDIDQVIHHHLGEQIKK